MSAHAVACDADSAHVELFEGRGKRFWKLLGNVRVHVVALVVWLLGRVDIEACAGTEIPGLILTLDIESSCTNSAD